MEIDFPSKTFLGVRFVLCGFDLINERKVRSKLVDGGGIDVDQYSQNCSHVIVDKLVYDAPVCVAARTDGKTLVTALWVDHSFDVGIPVDATSIMYRPLKDLNGIPGAKSLVVCLTGYQRQDRDDIMTMVGLMGAQFSKPLVANKVTHLICYKFEGEKYELAKKIKKIKLVNHCWLEDCLRDWELLPEDNYVRSSGYELEMMEIEAKDSEEEAEAYTSKEFGGRDMHKSPHSLKAGMPVACESPKSAIEVSPVLPNSTVPADPSDVFNSKDMLSTPGRVRKSPQASSFDNFNVPEVHGFEDAGTLRNVVHETTPKSATVDNGLVSTSKTAEKPSHSESKFSSTSYTRKTCRKSPQSTSLSKHVSGYVSHSPQANVSVSKVNDVFDILSSKVEHLEARTATGYIETPQKEGDSCHEEEFRGVLPQKRMTDISGVSSKLRRISQNARSCDVESPPVNHKTQVLESKSSVCHPLENNDYFSPANNDHYTNAAANLNAAVNSHASASTASPSSLNTKSLSPDLHSFGTVTLETRKNDNSDNKTPGTYKGSKESPVASKRDIGDFDMRSSSVVGEAEKLQNQPLIVEVSSTRNRDPEMDQSHRHVDLDLCQGGNDKLVAKPVRTKKVSKKTLGPRPTANQKGSIYYNKTACLTDPAVCLSEGEERSNEKFSRVHELEKSPPTTSAEAVKEADTKIVTKYGNDIINKTESMDDETEAPDEKDELEFGKTLNGEISEVVELLHKEDTMMTIEPGVSHVTKDFKVGTYDDDEMAAKEMMNGTEQGTMVGGKKLPLDESTAKGEDMGGNIIKGKKRPSGKTKAKAVLADKKTMKSKQIVGGEGTLDEKKAKEKVELPPASILESSMAIEKVNKPVDGDQNSCLDESTTKAEDMGRKINKGRKRPSGKAEAKTVAAPASKLASSTEAEKENKPVFDGDQNSSPGVGKSVLKSANTTTKLNKKVVHANSNSTPVGRVLSELKSEPSWFILSGHSPRLQRKEFQQIIRRLKGKFYRDSHQWSYQGTHFIAPNPLRRTEKFFAAAASGRWILKTDYLSACSQAGKFLPEEPYEWHKNGLNEDGAISLKAPRKWRLLRERTGHGAFYGMHIIVYGECIAPRLDTLKRAVKAGDGNILATSPPYSRFLKSGVDFAIVSPGTLRVDMWVQEFLKHEIPCVVADYLVEFVCKPGYPLDKYVLYNTHSWAEKSFANMISKVEVVLDSAPPSYSDSDSDDDIACQVCGCSDRGEVMLICGDESASVGCGIGTHIDCCDPPLESVPEEDWFCPNCITSSSTGPSKKQKKSSTSSKSQ
ncbi:hypothetical protein Ddye_017100 [Dipteronia dyeriana]|uniref:BRCT domain-containing protein n=1 Tax=Dipteronia dyeriana TaxID=168575 RepID=A0AAD9U8M0_9ROSI|nr:hypothetical protein Ddye_017100 [Dipteronia dyeriana]